MSDKKQMKVVFSPGCFDHFEGSQEELDAFVAEIQGVFTNMTEEELLAQSTQLTFEDFMDEGNEEELLAMLEAIENNQGRTLQ
jgi:hypothetical protein